MSEPPTLLLGDCFEVLQTLEAESVDACVTDPPYGLSFMGKHWDRGVPATDVWEQVYRVLKPGAHLLSFFGTRTYHRGVVAIEDAGFEIKDQIGWLYGVGFPKSLNISKALDKAAGAEREVVGKKQTPWKVVNEGAATFAIGEHGEYRSFDITAPATEAAKQWDGWGTALKPSHETLVHATKPLPIAVLCDNLALTLCRFPSIAKTADRCFGSSPSESGAGAGFALWRAVRSFSTREDLSAAMDMSQSELDQTFSLSIAWSWLHILGEVWRLASTFTTSTEIGLITDLKTLSYLVSQITPDSITQESTAASGGASSASLADAIFRSVSAKSEITRDTFVAGPAIDREGDNGLRRESIVLARKPFPGRTVAQNVLEHGVGGINVDACRLAPMAPDDPSRRGLGYGFTKEGDETDTMYAPKTRSAYDATKGRWPANLLHDGSDEVLAEFAKYGESKARPVKAEKIGASGSGEKSKSSEGWGMRGVVRSGYQDTETSVSRFFYTAKASKDDRNDGLWDWEHEEAPAAHCTVKPTSLMRYLVRLVCPKGGLVLDPFAGSGTTLIAAYREDCRAVGIELDPDYFKMASHRIDKATAQLRLEL